MAKNTGKGYREGAVRDRSQVHTPVGWVKRDSETALQQRARFLKRNTIGPRLELVRRFAAFTNQYPWQ